MFDLQKFNELHNVILGTSFEGVVNMRTVHFVVINDKICLLTSKSSTKVSEFSQNNNVTLFNSFMDEKSFTEQRLFATIKEHHDTNMDDYKEVYFAKYPYMKSSEQMIFGRDDNAIFELDLKSYRVVTPQKDETINL